MTPRSEADLLGATKFLPPRVPPGWVDRPRLSEALEQGLNGPLTLLAASAGAGKSALLSAWYANRSFAGPVCWLSLDAADADRRRFWHGVFAALTHGHAGAPVASLKLHPAEDIGIAIPALANALHELEQPVVLVLDDIHELGDSAVTADLDRLLRHPPENLRIVAATRVDPPLRMGRLRVEGAITEIRQADLAFTLEETGALLEASDIALAAEDVHRLWVRTEGWAAGLRLAALTLRRHPEPEAFVAAFAGDDVATADYLLSEVLAQQPPELVDFLLRTSIVDGVPADLADALTGRSDGVEVLAQLEREHALVTAVVGGTRTWHRYHRLLRELLLVRLHYLMPDEVPRLHERAAAWFVAHGRPADAVYHASEAQAWETVAALAAEHWLPLLLSGEVSSLRSVLEGLPDDRVRNDAELALAMAAVRLDAGEAQAGTRLLDRADELREEVPATRQQRFELGFAMAQLLAARALGDAALASKAGDVVLGAIGDACSPLASRDVRTYASLNLGIVELWLGRLDDAVRHLDGARRGAEATGAAWIRFLALGHLAAVAAFAGNARRARLLSEDALRFADAHGWARTWPAGMAEKALSTAALDGNDVRKAERFYQRGAELLSLASDRPLLAGSMLHAARLDLAAGRPDAALQKVDRYHDTIGDWPIMPEFGGLAVSVRARALAALGRAHEGARVVEFAQSVEPTAHAAAALGHLRLLQGDPEGALDAIELQNGAALPGVVTVEAGLLAALAHDAKADHPAAADSLERALDAAEPEGVRSPFAMLGPNVRVILRRQIRFGTAHRSLVDELLREVEQPAAARETRAVFAEELSDREAAVLRFLPTMMSNNEIAAELFVSANTVKSHLKSIYRKLDVADRRQAVRRARDMQLLGP